MFRVSWQTSITTFHVQQLTIRRNFAQLMKQQAHDSGAKPLAKSAITSLLEHSCRLAEHQNRLSAHINDALEIIGEANFFWSLPKKSKERIYSKHLNA